MQRFKAPGEAWPVPVSQELMIQARDDSKQIHGGYSFPGELSDGGREGRAKFDFFGAHYTPGCLPGVFVEY